MAKPATKITLAHQPPAQAPRPTARPAFISLEPDHNFLRAVLEGERTIGHLFVDPEFVKRYDDEGLTESNPDIRNEKGEVATRLTDEGRELIGAAGEDADYEGDGSAHGRAYGRDEGEGEGEGEGDESLTASDYAFELDDDIPIPGKRRRARKALYPFEKMNVGKSFHVPKDPRRDLKEMLKGFASTVSAANARFAVPTGEQEQITVSTYETDADGARVKRNGHYVKTGQRVVTRPKMRREREFSAYIASPDDPRGPGIRVFRIR